ncbi:sugar ABC transporter substrate-binding protein [Streptacidiphilus fuscans]|uniref:Substrate-binding domain-containing protein n=1 Tax=Streptacidiphilus fuscans TaxID=2789292 RepID=A0A931B9B6_9ACTN|nr:substrate-binding domain-containing protein [Streptacidiphilus fuscans]MBF9073630.1 substrate-binding domain-containing protein [Streptacidiphilus fuscans]
MKHPLQRAATATAVVSLVLAAAACGKTGSASSSSSASPSSGGSAVSASGSIGLLLPENTTTRYEQFDKPYFEAKVKQLAPNVTVNYANAGGSAQVQAQQVQTMINEGVKVIVVDPQDSTQIKASVDAAHAKGIKVVSYDRLAEGPVDAYVSFDNVRVGQLQGTGLIDALGSKASPSAKIVEIDGAQSDPNAAQFKSGFQGAVKGKLDIAYDASGQWLPDVAAQKATAAINQLGAHNIAGFYSANDEMAAGIATSMKNAGLSGLPLTGQDAQLDAIQRIVAGTQSFTIYKAYKPEADSAAQMAVDLLTGQSTASIANTTQTNGSGNKVPADLLTPVLVNKDNIKSTVVADGLWTIPQICTPTYAAACKSAGLE